MAKGRNTRKLLLDRGHALASERGLHGVSIGRLADAAGISKAGIYAHFDSKDHLLEGILDHAVEKFVERVLEPALREAPGEPRLRRLVQDWLAWVEAQEVPGGCVFIASASELDDRPGPLRETLVELQQRWTRMLRETAREARDQGHFREDVDPDQLAFELHGLVQAYHLYRRLFRDETARARARYAFEALLERARGL